MRQRYRQWKFRLYKWRAAWRKRRRLLFPSPAEAELIRIMGGKRIIIDYIKDRRTGFPLCFVTDLGLLSREGIQREVRVGAMYIDFATVGLAYQKGIEVDGKMWHMDVVHEMERNEYVSQYGYALLHIPAGEIWRNPTRVQQRVLKFLAQ